MFDIFNYDLEHFQLSDIHRFWRAVGILFNSKHFLRHLGRSFFQLTTKLDLFLPLVKILTKKIYELQEIANFILIFLTLKNFAKCRALLSQNDS